MGMGAGNVENPVDNVENLCGFSIPFSDPGSDAGRFLSIFGPKLVGQNAQRGKTLCKTTNRYPSPSLRRMALAARTPEAPAWAKPRVMPAPSPAAKKLGRVVSRSVVSCSRAE